MYRNRNTYKNTDFKGEINNSPSKTVEGEAFTIAELYQRSAGLLRDQVTKEEFYDGDPQHEDVDFNLIARSDLTEQHDAIETTMEQDIENKRKSLRKAKKKSEPIEKTEEPEKVESSKSPSVDEETQHMTT